MSISGALEELVEKVRELGIGNYFDGMDNDDIIEMGLYFYGKHIENNLDGIMKDMEIDSESIEGREWCGYCKELVNPVIAADGHRVCPMCLDDDLTDDEQGCHHNPLKS